jgi:hypothetical protein
LFFAAYWLWPGRPRCSRDAGNVRKMLKRVCAEAGIRDGWTGREWQTSFGSSRSHRVLSIEEIAELCGAIGLRADALVLCRLARRRRRFQSELTARP